MQDERRTAVGNRREKEIEEEKRKKIRRKKKRKGATLLPLLYMEIDRWRERENKREKVEREMKAPRDPLHR